MSDQRVPLPGDRPEPIPQPPRVAIGAGLLAVASLVSAQIPVPIHVVPFVAGGADAQGGAWTTELTVANLGTATAVVGGRLFRAGSEGGFDGTFPATRAIAPGQSVILDDAVTGWLGQKGAARGWLLLGDAAPIDCSATDRPYPARLAVSTRLALRGAAGTSRGAAFQPSWLSVNIAPGLPSVFPGLRPDARRTLRLAVANLSTQPAAIAIELTASSGERLARPTRRIAALSAGDWSLAELGLKPTVAAPVQLAVALADEPGRWDPCTVAASPPACADPCDRTVCPQRYRLPGAPALYAVVLEADTQSGAVDVVAPVVDQVLGVRQGNEFQQRHCPGAGGASRLIDLFAKLVLLREPPPVLRKVER